MRRAPILLVAAAMIAAACSDADNGTSTSTTIGVSTTIPASSTTGVPTTTTTSSTTKTSPTTTTSTTEPQIPISPLNGLEVTDGSLLERRVMAVKIDNHPKARPQSGLQEADAVIELMVEGVTRFIALFHNSDSGYLGPVRSIRPTDSTLLAGLGATFTVSGGQAWIRALATERDVEFMTEGVEGLYRIPTRFAPQNLYADTVALRDTADARGYDDDFDGPLFTFGVWDEPPETTAETITLDWAAGAQVRWRLVDGRYLRFAAGSEHRWVDAEGNGGQLVFDVLVVIVGDQYSARPGPGLGGGSVPATDTLGSGPMVIFSNGYLVEGTWERDEITEPFRLFDTHGNPVTVPPGLPWISIYPDTQSFRWE
jgi:hypothetical protein